MAIATRSTLESGRGRAAPPPRRAHGTGEERASGSYSDVEVQIRDRPKVVMLNTSRLRTSHGSGRPPRRSERQATAYVASNATAEPVLRSVQTAFEKTARNAIRVLRPRRRVRDEALHGFEVPPTSHNGASPGRRSKRKKGTAQQDESGSDERLKRDCLRATERRPGRSIRTSCVRRPSGRERPPPLCSAYWRVVL